MNPTTEFVEAWRAVANAKLLEFRRQCWRLAEPVALGVVSKAEAITLGNRACTRIGADSWRGPGRSSRKHSPAQSSTHFMSPRLWREQK
jgi:hypothetical protein